MQRRDADLNDVKYGYFHFNDFADLRLYCVKMLQRVPTFIAFFNIEVFAHLPNDPGKHSHMISKQVEKEFVFDRDLIDAEWWWKELADKLVLVDIEDIPVTKSGYCLEVQNGINASIIQCQMNHNSLVKDHGRALDPDDEIYSLPTDITYQQFRELKDSGWTNPRRRAASKYKSKKERTSAQNAAARDYKRTWQRNKRAKDKAMKNIALIGATGTGKTWSLMKQLPNPLLVRKITHVI